MNGFTRENLHNIRRTFEEKTGVNLSRERPVYPKRKAKYLLLAAVICVLLLASCTQTLFSGLGGDELSLAGTYLGDGIISVEVENRSDRELEFQKQVKLMRWTDGEVEPLPGGKVRIENTRFPAHSGGTMLVDISGVYDIAALESDTPETPKESWYYLVLTNHNFLFGHDWMCSFRFVEPVEETTPTEQPEPATQPEPVQTLNPEEIDDNLKYYFEDTYLDEPPAHTQAHFVYQQKVRELLARTKGTLVSPVDPHIVVNIPENQVFDEALPKDIQYLLVGEQYHSIDAFHRIVGAEFSGTGSDQSFQLMAMLPEYSGQTDGGQYLPIVYLFVYERAALSVDAPYAFVSGRVLPFSDMEKDKVFEDERYVIYDMTDLFYTDLDEYMDKFVAAMEGKVPLYFDEQIRRRVHNIRDFLRDGQTLPTLIQNRQSEMEALGYQKAK